MAAVYDPTDPIHLSPEQRLDELAALLATGSPGPSTAPGTSNSVAQRIPSRICSEWT